MFDEISDSLFWIYQYAVFGDSSLSSLKLWKDIDYIYMNELDDEEVDDVDFDDEIFDEIDVILGGEFLTERFWFEFGQLRIKYMEDKNG